MNLSIVFSRIYCSGYQWVSGDGYSYQNWKVGEPNDWDGLEPCVMMDGADGLWNDEKCFIPMNWICSINRGLYIHYCIYTHTCIHVAGYTICSDNEYLIMRRLQLCVGIFWNVPSIISELCSNERTE